MYIERIKNGEDLKKLSIQQLEVLADEIRHAIIQRCSEYGGHLGSNMGIVEITVALHYIFNVEVDKLVFDVSHQTFSHKMLTGRSEAYTNPEKYSDVIEFTHPNESPADLFHMGHTSTSISLACGLARARDVLERHERVIAVIGDASLGGGQAFEGMNIAATLNSQLLIILNDNEMSVFDNHGSLYPHLTQLRNSNGTSTNNIFKNMGFDYHYLEHGNDMGKVIAFIAENADNPRPTVLHIHTQKGKGFTPAETEKARWHFTKPFDLTTNQIKSSLKTPSENYGNITFEYLSKRMEKDSRINVVTASTPSAIGFGPARVYGTALEKQFLDVGIEEQNAFSIAAGMAVGGAKVVIGTWASFYQRAYDQIAHEICLNNIPVTMIVTNASVLGDPNDTHAGLFDIAMLSSMPNILYLAPANKQEYLSMLEWSLDNQKLPVAIRTPWHGVHYTECSEKGTNWEIPKYKVEQAGNQIAVLALGGFFEMGKKACACLKEKYGVTCTLINPRYANRLDKTVLDELKGTHQLVATLEDASVTGGFGAMIAQYYACDPMQVKNFGFHERIPAEFHPADFMEANGLTPEKIADEIASLCALNQQ